MKRLLRSILPFSGLVLAIILIKTISVSAYTVNNPTTIDASLNSRAIAASSPTTPEGAILVTTLEDELNNDGDCSLREAIQAANTNTTCGCLRDRRRAHRYDRLRCDRHDHSHQPAFGDEWWTADN